VQAPSEQHNSRFQPSRWDTTLLPRYNTARFLALLLACLLLSTGLNACGNKGPLKKPQPSTTQAE
jgi:hypothetical protein